MPQASLLDTRIETLVNGRRLCREIACPTLVLWAERDKHFPLVQAERLHETIPNSQLEVIPGGTHWMALDRADELTASIRKLAGP